MERSPTQRQPPPGSSLPLPSASSLVHRPPRLQEGRDASLPREPAGPVSLPASVCSDSHRSKVLPLSHHVFFFPELAPLAVADSFWVTSQLLQDESLCPGLCCVLQVFFN